MMEVGRIDEQEPVAPVFLSGSDSIVPSVADEEIPDVDDIEATGMARGLAKGIVTVCEVLEIPLDEARLGAIESLDVGGLEQLLDTLADERRWP
jgi:hypothetical protein